MSFTIPNTIDEAVTSLDGIGRLVTAKEWERAAIVYALVGPATGRGPNQKSTSALLEIKGPGGLAAKGIHGLRSQHSIERYRDAWQSAIDEGAAEPVSLGDELVIPDDWEWPPDETHRRLDNGPRREAVEQQAQADGVSTASALRVAESTKAMAAAIKADPVAAAAAAEALVSDERGIRALRTAEHEVAKARNEADPDFGRRVAKVERDMALDTADADAALKRITRQRNLAFLDICLMEWARDRDMEAIEHVALKLDEVRGVIAAQAQELTPEMFTEEVSDDRDQR